MQEKPDRDAIVDEALGQTHGTASLGSMTEKERISPEEAARRNATPPGPQASMSEKTAAAVGERVGDAYADPGSVRPPQWNTARSAAIKPGTQSHPADRVRSAGQQVAQSVSEQFSEQRFVTLVAAFGLGFIAATVLRGRR
jgi:hypothetical protein